MQAIYGILVVIVTSGCVAGLLWWVHRLFWPLEVVIRQSPGEPIQHGWGEKRRQEMKESSGIEGL